MTGFHASEVAAEIGVRVRPVVEAVRRRDADAQPRRGPRGSIAT